MGVVRIIRVLEYTYASPEAAERDMQQWFIPGNGTKTVGLGDSKKTVRSAVVMDLGSQ